MRGPLDQPILRVLYQSGKVLAPKGLRIGSQSPQPTRNYIAALDASTSNATDWNPNADGWVQAIAVSGTTVYAGGGFKSIGSQSPQPTRNHVAALDASTGNATRWDPDANSTVEALSVSDSTVYAGGYFTAIGPQVTGTFAPLNR